MARQGTPGDGRAGLMTGSQHSGADDGGQHSARRVEGGDARSFQTGQGLSRAAGLLLS